MLIFDMDIGMGNVDILLGLHSRHNIVDFFDREIPLKKIINTGPENISFITGGTGLTSLFSLGEAAFSRFMTEFNELLHDYDYIIFDMGAGITEESAQFLLCVDELIVISTPEPTSIMDAYSVMKYIHSLKSDLPYFLVCNRVMNDQEGKTTITRLENALNKFLQKEVVVLGYLPDDRIVSTAVTRQVPFILFDSEAKVSKAMVNLAYRYDKHAYSEDIVLPKSGFLQNMKRYFFGR